MYYVNCTHGFVRGIKHYKAKQAIFETCNDIRTAKVWENAADAQEWMEEVAFYNNHYTILSPILMGDRFGFNRRKN